MYAFANQNLTVFAHAITFWWQSSLYQAVNWLWAQSHRLQGTLVGFETRVGCVCAPTNFEEGGSIFLCDMLGKAHRSRRDQRHFPDYKNCN